MSLKHSLKRVDSGEDGGVYYKYVKKKNARYDQIWNEKTQQIDVSDPLDEEYEDEMYSCFYGTPVHRWSNIRYNEAKKRVNRNSIQLLSHTRERRSSPSRRYREISHYEDLEEETNDTIHYDTIPYRVVIYILEFFDLEDDNREFYQRIKSSDELIPLLYGYFKLDIMRKPFLVFPNLRFMGKCYSRHKDFIQEFNNHRSTVVKNLPPKTRSINVSYCVIESCPKQLKALRLVLPRCEDSTGEVFLKDIWKLQGLVKRIPKSLRKFEIHVYPQRYHLLFDVLHSLHNTLTSFTFRTVRPRPLYYFDSNIGKSFPKLRYLNLGVMNFTQTGLTNLPPSLITVQIESGGKIDYKGQLNGCFQHLTKLKKLTLKYFKCDRDALTGLPKCLKRLEIHCNHRLIDSDITNVFFPTLSDNEDHSSKYQIKTLLLNYCPSLTSKLLDVIRENRNMETFERLEIVQSTIESKKVDEFRKLCPNVQVKYSKKVLAGIDYSTYRRT